MVLVPAASVSGMHQSGPDSSARFRSVLSQDADEHARNLSAWDQTYEQLGPGAFSGRLDEIWLEDLQLFRERTNLQVLQTGLPWPGARTFGIPLAVGGEGSFQGKPVGDATIVTFGPAQELYLRTPALLDVVGISLPADRLQALGLQIDGFDPEAFLADRCLLPLAADTMTGVRAYLRALFETLEHAPQTLLPAPVQRAIRDAVIELLFNATRAAEAEPSLGTGSAAHYAAARLARDYIAARTAEPLTVLEVCRALGISRRTLQTSFQAVLGVSPHQYLHAVRLNGLRRALRAAPPGASVLALAADWGFWHPSSCAAEYRKLFGELPSTTLRRHHDS